MTGPKKQTRSRRTTWNEPTVKPVGTLQDVLKGGGGKLSIISDDTGDAPRKPKGQENQ